MSKTFFLWPPQEVKIKVPKIVVPHACFVCVHYVICSYMFTSRFQYEFNRWQLVFQLEDINNELLVVSDMLLFWCSWFKYRFIKIDLVTVAKFCFHFNCVLGSLIDSINVNPVCARHLNNALHDVQSPKLTVHDTEQDQHFPWHWLLLDLTMPQWQWNGHDIWLGNTYIKNASRYKSWPKWNSMADIL